MSRALIIALSLHMANAAKPEWKGVFHTPDNTYKWGAQKVKGKYADDLSSMKMVVIPVTGATAATLTGATAKGEAAYETTCVDLDKTGKIVPMENKCYNLKFDMASAETIFTIDATNTKDIAFFTEHLPTEFEDTAHYLKDTSGADIEPQAQAPVPSAHGHSHGHGGTDAFMGNCVCKAQANNWKLDCNNQAKISEAIVNLDGNTACKAKNAPKACEDSYYVLQSHHDHY